MRRIIPILIVGCSFTATKDPLSYEDLSDGQKHAVDRINENLRRIDAALRQPENGGPSIEGILDKAEVGFEGILLAVNLGDQRARVSVWEDLTPGQHDLLSEWWAKPLGQAEAIYPSIVYDYMALHLGALEFIYVVQGVERVFENRPRYNVERDAARIATAYAREHWPAVTDPLMEVCGPMRAQYDATWAHRHDDPDTKATQRWFQQNLRELADPKEPTGYFYFLCRWVGDGLDRTTSLRNEMDLIKERFGYP